MQIKSLGIIAMYIIMYILFVNLYSMESIFNCFILTLNRLLFGERRNKE